MQLKDDKVFLGVTIARIDRRSEELALPLREPFSLLVLEAVIVLATIAGPTIFGADVLFVLWLG